MSNEDLAASMPDWFLQTIVRIVNEGDSEIGVTLTLGGTVISGLLVGGAKYFEAFGNEFASAFKEPEIAANIYSAFSSHSKIYEKKESESEAEEVLPPIYIHLKNAKFFHNSGPAFPTNRGIWWRGRLSSVDGFALGVLGPSA